MVARLLLFLYTRQYPVRGTEEWQTLDDEYYYAHRKQLASMIKCDDNEEEIPTISLCVEAAVYGLAEKYEVPRLKQLSLEAYQASAKMNVRSPPAIAQFTRSIEIVYSTTKPPDQLRDFVIWKTQTDYLTTPYFTLFRELFTSNRDFAWDLKVAVADIKHLHVYDFDNTLFSSPLPNPQLWAGPTLGLLQAYECFANAGGTKRLWAHPVHSRATGIDELQVQLVELSIKQKDALTVLLTGRGETNFADVVKRIVDSKGLNFDLICLKPEVGPNGQHFVTTAEFKNEFLKHLVFTYKHADEIRIYEDRPKHVKHFREYFEKLNKSLLSHPIDQPPPPRKPITADVIQVTELNSYLDPVIETSSIQALINKHNTVVTKGLPNTTRSPYPRMKITSSYIYFGYLINPTDSARLLTLAYIQPPSLIDSSDIRLMANSILIAPRPPNRQTLDKVGGKGKKVTWQVTGTAVFENKIWAARVAPVPETEKYYTNDPVPVVVLAVRKGARPIDAGRIQNWQPVPAEKAFIFETVVGDKQTLKVEAEDSGDDRYESRPSNRGGTTNGYYGGCSRFPSHPI
ncbi:hypothetical protein EPUS_04536 [Endocarpon pusillum Z07020]|uniref:Swiss Army Knife RNA repair protein HAD domain-containing protein n=1 Tax=Endocarpon pusillum (strain Z07020 / HMAS-L-300199) TaxID=1263415 RepID=U1HIZ3_ENDPU|nr:uncharacterized protein EPUS_04536 [Endocarpon pusillum Z07020]ERF68884.1 hypothetical protein EPUS_04536 [Endocarpon pusillum Z07020]